MLTVCDMAWNFPLKITLTHSSALQTTYNESKQRQTDSTKIDKFDLQYSYRYKNNKRQRVCKANDIRADW